MMRNLATDIIAHRVSNTGCDPSKLGHWTWITIKGSASNIQIISAYRPIHSLGPKTVDAQHDRVLSKTTTNDPREDILTTLHAVIRNWIHQGDHIILCIDANDDV